MMAKPSCGLCGMHTQLVVFVAGAQAVAPERAPGVSWFILPAAPDPSAGEGSATMHDLKVRPC